ncbi:SixA phosphatase family protein [Marivita sp. S0852]|uniref:SixA phosphatase family protein n=1 Tax=Marivita sp. S0852 TaxID=3373893 RepID=UPI0039827016
MRHAKSDWSTSGDDHSRPLNARGMKSAVAMGDWVRQHNWVPEQALCSSATRTRQTLDLLGFDDLQTRFERGLYLAEARDMIGCLQTAQADTVLMVGHNHGIADCAHQLVADWPDHPRFADYPTCATCLISFDIADWSDAAPGLGRCTEFAIPREVIAAAQK